MDHDLKLRICEALKVYGGGFDKALAEAMIRADYANLERIVCSFPEIIEKGKAMADRMKRDEE